IQSSARVGRKRPGTVIDMFRPYDERDKHRYRYFEKTHEYLRRSIEAVSIDRWSKYSLEKTFAGIFKALLIQHYRPLMHRRYGVNVQSSRQLQDVIDDPASYPEFDRDTYSDLIRRSYGLHIESNDYFDHRIDEKMENYWEYWVKRIRSEYYTTIKGEAMRSLRDIGEQVDIGVDREYDDFYTALVEGDD
ncbi:MAG: helicase, partial [archaeon]